MVRNPVAARGGHEPVSHGLLVLDYASTQEAWVETERAGEGMKISPVIEPEEQRSLDKPCGSHLSLSMRRVQSSRRGR